MLKKHYETMFKRLSSVMFKKHSEQPTEEDQLDPTSRLDSTSLILFKISFHFCLELGLSNFESGTNKLQTATSMLRKKILRTDSVYEITGNISTFHSLISLRTKTSSRTYSVYEITCNNSKFHSLRSLLKKLEVFAHRFDPRNNLKYFRVS